MLSPVMFAPSGITLIAESCASPNQAVDPGETVTMDMSLQNVGSSNTTALVATLLPVSGVTAPSTPQFYGAVLGNGGIASRSFIFTASGPCGGTVVATLQLQDGTNDLGAVAFPGSPEFLPPVLNAGQIYLRFATWPGRTYLIQFKNSLNDPSWQTLETVVGDGTFRTFQYPIDGAPQRFFRAVENP